MVRCFEGTYDGIAGGLVEECEQREGSRFLSQVTSPETQGDGKNCRRRGFGDMVRSSVLDMN